MKQKLIIWFRGAAKSATIRFNSIALIVSLALPSLQDALPQLQQYVPPNAYKWIALFAIGANILLRAKTSKSLMAKAQP